MTKYISFKVEEKDIQSVRDFTKKLGIEISESPNPKNEDEMREWAMNFFSEQSSFGDALEWQKKERNYRKLPYRD